MTKKEAMDILDAVDVDCKSLDPIIFEGGNYEKSANYIMKVTGCDKEMAMEIAYEIFPPEAYEDYMVRSTAREAEEAKVCKPKCPTCGSTDIKPAGVLDFLFAMSHGTNTHSFVCKNCGYEW